VKYFSDFFSIFDYLLNTVVSAAALLFFERVNIISCIHVFITSLNEEDLSLTLVW